MKLINLFLLMVFAFTAFACNNGGVSSASEQERAATEIAMQEQMRAVGMPAITNWQEKKLFKMIYELRDQEKLVCYAYIVDMHGELHFLTKCLGYGIPYSTQYTNPETIAYKVHNTGVATLPQADPNGMYMPTGLAATWIIAYKEDGTLHPIYVEPEIIVSPLKLH